MKTFLTQLQQDPETYELFLEEAKSRGYYDGKKIRNQTLEYGRKDYFRQFIAEDNKKGNNETDLKKYILYKETVMSRQGRVKVHLDRLLNPEEKKTHSFIPPKREELPLAFPPEAITKKKPDIY